MSNSSRPHGLQPTRLPCPWDFPGKTSHVLIPDFSSLTSRVSLKQNGGDIKQVVVIVWWINHAPLFFNPMDCRPPGSSVHGISQARILKSVLLFPSLGDLSDRGIEPASPALSDSLKLSYHRRPILMILIS